MPGRLKNLIEQDQKILKLIMNVMNILSVIVLTGVFSVAYNAYISKMFMFIWIKTNFDWMLSVMQIKTLAKQVSHCHWFEAKEKNMAEMSHLKPVGRDHKWESTNDCEEYQVKRWPQKVFENSLFFFLQGLMFILEIFSFKTFWHNSLNWRGWQKNV